jgi:HSP20 family protein
MQKRTRPKSIARLLSERARAGEPDANAHHVDIAALGGTASEILGHLKDVFEKVVQATEAVEQGERGDVPFTLGGKQGRVVFGYNMRMGLDGLKAEPFGDIPPARPKAEAAQTPAARAPIVDVFEEADTLRIVAELPGVSAEDVSCALDGDTLVIETRRGTGDSGQGPVYGKRVVLPAPVDPASLVQACRNGILEIRLNRASG